MERRTIDEIQVAAEPGAWRAAGFNVAGHVCEVGSARLRLLGEGPSRGIVFVVGARARLRLRRERRSLPIHMALPGSGNLLPRG